MADPIWTSGEIVANRFCTLCPQPAVFLGDAYRSYDVVYLCTDCADALADVVNERRAEQRAAMDELLQDSVEMGVYD